MAAEGSQPKRIRFSNDAVEKNALYCTGQYTPNPDVDAAFGKFEALINTFTEELRKLHGEHVDAKKIPVDVGSMINVFAKLGEVQTMYHKALYFPQTAIKNE